MWPGSCTGFPGSEVCSPVRFDLSDQGYQARLAVGRVLYAESQRDRRPLDAARKAHPAEEDFHIRRQTTTAQEVDRQQDAADDKYLTHETNL